MRRGLCCVVDTSPGDYEELLGNSVTATQIASKDRLSCQNGGNNRSGSGSILRNASCRFDLTASREHQ